MHIIFVTALIKLFYISQNTFEVKCKLRENKLQLGERPMFDYM